MLVLPFASTSAWWRYPPVPKWWALKNRVQYFDAAIFKVTLDSGVVVRLVIPVDAENTEVKVRHDGTVTSPSLSTVVLIVLLLLQRQQSLQGVSVPCYF